MISNPFLSHWIGEAVSLCKPARVHVCTGSDEEYQQLCALLVAKGTFVPLKRPSSFWCRSDPSDVARVEEATFICSRFKEEAGPTNNWRDPEEMLALLRRKFSGSMRGRTLYVIPFCMGPLHSPHSRIGVQITDSAYVACSMKIMTLMGSEVLQKLGAGPFVPCMHTVGMPLPEGIQDVPWPCNSEKYIVHFPETHQIWSFGSGYGGNALLGKKSLALRIASCMGRREGWLAEHMLIVGITPPGGEKKYIAAAFPSACGKTNLALLAPTLPGWKVECIGDDIAWLHVGVDGRLYALNPEAGFFCVAPGTSMRSNANALETIQRNTLFTNVALTDERDVWWEGMTQTPPGHLIDWTDRDWSPDCGRSAAHPNARFTVPIAQCPILDPAFYSTQGVPLSAIVFGGRRASLVPLVYEALSWNHGVLIGASLSSETTAAAQGSVGTLRRDPFAMLPFCGYNMADYFAHWLEIGARLTRPPRIFHVNWFRKSAEGDYLWPGFGDNSRVLKWMVERIEGRVTSLLTPLGHSPRPEDLDLLGLSLSPDALQELFQIDPVGWLGEIAQLRSYFSVFGSRFPDALHSEADALEARFKGII
jgi:phosphoenolpyruvate carboxykinase (GTP)